MKNDRRLFPLGASHAPFARALGSPRAEWEKDIRDMRKLNFTHVNVFAAWHKIEPEKGRFDFGELDYIMELAGQNEMEVSVKIGIFQAYAFHHPRWLMKEYKGDVILEKDFRPRAYGLHTLPCPDDPAYGAHADKYMRKLVSHFKGCETLRCWIVWGEPSRECYCKSTLKEFRKWLECKYSDIGALNEKWNTEGASDFDSWDEVEAPSGFIHYGGGYAPYLDWLEFTEDNLSAKVRRVHDLVKEVDPSKDTITELNGGHYNNYFKMASTADILGFSQFRVNGHVVSFNMDLCRSAAQAEKKESWMMEMQGGPVLSSWGSPSVLSPKQTALCAWQYIAHGAKACIYWTYRPRLSDWEGGEFGIMNADGSMTDRALEIGKVFKTVSRHKDIFLDAEFKAETAILYSQRNNQITNMERADRGDCAWLADARYGAYKMLWEANIPIDFIAPETIASAPLGKYKSVILPSIYSIDRKTACALKEYVRNGGVLIADFPCSVKDEHGVCYYLPDDGLAEIFGVREKLLENVPEQDVIMMESRKKIDAFLCKQSYEITGNGTGLSSEKRYPSAVVSSFGKGKAVLIGTMFFLRYHEKQGHAYSREFLAGLMKKYAKVEPPLKVSGIPERKRANLEIVILHCPAKGRLVVILNHNKESCKGVLKLRERVRSISDLGTGEKINNGKGGIAFFVAPEDAKTYFLHAGRSCPRQAGKRA